MTALIRRALRIAGPDIRRRLLWMIPGGVGLTALEIAAFGLLIPFIDAVVGGDEPGRVLTTYAEFLGADSRDDVLAIAAASMAALLLTKSLASMAFYWWQFGVLAAAEARKATWLVGRYLSASIGFHTRHNTAEAVRNVNAAVNGLFRQVLIPAVTMTIEFARLGAVLLVLIIADPLIMAILALSLTLLGLGFVAAIARPARRLSDKSYDLNGESIRQMQEAVAGIKIIQASNRQPSMIARFFALRDELRPVRHHASFLSALSRYYLEIGFVLGVGGLVAILTAFRDGSAALSGLAVTLVAAFTVLPSVGRVLGQISIIRLGEAAVTSLGDVVADLDEDSRLQRVGTGSADSVPGDAEPHHSRQELLSHSIRFDGLGVTHNDGRVALRHIDLEIGQGETIGVVGRSGAGKTTLVDVLLGLTRPTAGVLSVDGEEIGHDEWSWWRSQVGYVPQDVFLLDDSVTANVTLAETPDNVDHDRLADALAQAQLEEVVRELPDGQATRLGEGGMKLSGGQRQRLGLARALYRRPTVLVLDEATSALDLATEQEVQRVLRRLRGELTLVIVAHRLNTVRFCDRIIVMEDGVVDSTGSFEELESSSALFGELMTLESALASSNGKSSPA